MYFPHRRDSPPVLLTWGRPCFSLAAHQLAPFTSPQPPPPIQLWGLQSLLRSSQVTWPGRAWGTLRRSGYGRRRGFRCSCPAGFCEGASTEICQPGLRRRWPWQARTSPPGRFPVRLVSRKRAPGRERGVGTAAGAGSGAQEACVPRRVPGRLARPWPRPRCDCDTVRVRLALLRSPARARLSPGREMPPRSPAESARAGNPSLAA